MGKKTSVELGNTGISFAILIDDKLASLYGGAHVKGREGLIYVFEHGQKGKLFDVIVVSDGRSVFDGKSVVIATSKRCPLFSPNGGGSTQETQFPVTGKGPEGEIRVIVFDGDNMVADKVLEIR